MFALQGLASYLIMQNSYAYYFAGYAIKYRMGIQYQKYGKDSCEYLKHIPYFVAKQTFI